MVLREEFRDTTLSLGFVVVCLEDCPVRASRYSLACEESKLLKEPSGRVTTEVLRLNALAPFALKTKHASSRLYPWLQSTPF